MRWNASVEDFRAEFSSLIGQHATDLIEAYWFVEIPANRPALDRDRDKACGRRSGQLVLRRPRLAGLHTTSGAGAIRDRCGMEYCRRHLPAWARALRVSRHRVGQQIGNFARELKPQVLCAAREMLG